ncbi:dehydrogenase/reductase SDR family member 2, mitochondrial isoform X2 [Canis lupus baileyi]|uniref:dehydrogenase/reductase SDR family member 2, mitochondrial isoform X2 n=1 Tax=Canis lupus familiaris TaxID=9615 RepID=UPI000BAA05EA|nr:dehydrogenase/reductase SDR family member 2, mitochondrial isoform X2 [Canis lupus familiaris]XP_038400184.1 dehydrogenase/reductase SDR family member 2, mitochondrial isoform X2 [Canis lupus familiaris]XP_038529108.1 dehydrogenase/reductase SDR family member 2, mitochondrial isoform X2 [Canis lupus familiaris]XP_048969549.1 dehydrogenase/reductase SDR family member 2, mitochondrial isoform X3 [Canis lupus dingo]|eukprot:XP_013971251.2 dehydrogenase/reductase SDR family member 2, mitochondrial isoform X2 [Canis lupus familiaris]
MFQAVAYVSRGLFRSYAGLSVRMNSTGIDQKGVLANRVAVVTGATDGIGFAIARRLARDGAHVVVSSRKQHNVDRAVAALQGEGLSVTGTVCHVGKAEDRERLVATVLEHYGGLDFLVCNAAVNPLVRSTLQASEEVWDKELGPYNVSKTALLGLTRTLSLELAPKGIRVNCLVPGIIKTNFSKVLHMNEVFWNNFKEKYRLQRLGQPEDCAGLVSFLCSPDACYINGENIVVAGFSPQL